MAKRLKGRRHGALAVIGSVAGDRGRASNAVYGSAKEAVAACCSALRQWLTQAGVKPGLVDTPMTAALPNGLLWAQPASVAQTIAPVDRRRATVYAPFDWCWIMLAVRDIPEPLFRRMHF